MKKATLSLMFIAIGALTFTSCKKDNFCYSCSATGTSNWNFGQSVVREACDLEKSERDAIANDFEANYPVESWNTACSRRSE